MPGQTYYGPESAAKALRKRLNRLDVATLFVDPGSPRKNGYAESYIGWPPDELLNGEVLDRWMETKVTIGGWRQEDNRFRPHGPLGYRPPAPGEAKWLENPHEEVVHGLGAGHLENHRATDFG